MLYNNIFLTIKITMKIPNFKRCVTMKTATDVVHIVHGTVSFTEVYLYMTTRDMNISLVI